MNLNFRLPHITGNTVPEQLAQIVSYLRQLATQLQKLPEVAEPETPVQERVRANVFQNLHVRRELVADRGINGVCLGSVRQEGTAPIRLQSKFSRWGESGEAWQSFLISGSVEGTPIHGVMVVDSAGDALWSGTEGVCIVSEEKGILQILLPGACNDGLLIQSPETFIIL